MADNLNIKNPSVTKGELDLRTDASGNIVSISGHPIAGGAGGGNVYFGDDEYIQYKTGTTNTFTLTDEVKDVIDHIPQTVATEVNRISYTKNAIDNKLDDKQDKLVFDYDEDNKVSAINGSALAGQGGTTYTPGQYIDITNNKISVTGVVGADEYATYSGDWNDVSNSYKTNSGSFLTSEDLTNYYPKTQTSSDNELSTEFAKYATTTYVDDSDPILVGDANITAVSSRANHRTTWNLSVNATPVVTDTKLTGDNCVTAHTTQVSGEWEIGLVQTAYEAIESVGGIATDVATLKNASAEWNKVSDKLDTTVAEQTYLEKATYASDSATFLTKTSADNDYAPKTITATVNELTGASAKWENASDVVATNSADWNGKVDPSDLNNYLTTAQYGTDSATFLTAHQSLDGYATLATLGTVSSELLTKTQYATDSATFALKNQLDDYATLDQLETVSGKLLTTAQYANDSATFLTAHQSLANYYTKSETSGATELSNEFAKYVTSSNVSTPDTDYVMTTTGWKVLTLPGGGMTQVIHDTTLTGQGNANDSKLGVAWSALSGNTIDSALSASSATSSYWAVKAKDKDGGEWNIGNNLKSQNNFISFIDNWAEFAINGNSGIDVLDLDEDGYPETFQLTNTAYNAITSVSNKVNKPTSLVDKYLVLRTDSNGDVSGWCDFQDQSYSKTEANGTFVATANIDTTTLSGDGKSVNTKLGVKTDVIATKDYVNSSFLPTSGGTVSGETILSAATGTFDNSYLKCINDSNVGYARFGLGSYGGAVIKTVDNNNTRLQVNIKTNANNNELMSVQINDNTIGYLIPAVTSTTTAGLTNDGILHIIVES